MSVVNDPAAPAADTGTSPTTVAPALRNRLDGTDLAVTGRRVLRSEWIRLRTVRSWMIMIGSAAAVLVAFGALAASVASGDVTPANGRPPAGGGPFATTDPTALSLAGVTLAQLIVGILGVLLISNEYANGLIRTTFAAVPRRLPVLWAKAIVLATTLAVVMVLAALAAFFVGQAILGGDRSTTLAADGVLRAVLGSGLYLAGIGVLGIAVGALLRNTAGAIAVIVASLLIIPGLLGVVLPDSWSDAITPYLPSNAGSAFTSVTGSSTLLSPGAGAAVFVGWVVVLLVGAAVLIRRFRATGLTVQTVISGVPASLPPAVDLVAYRVVQESLTNARKHAGETDVVLRFDYGTDALDLSVVNSGTGDRSARAGRAAATTGGFGLLGMRERVASVRGAFEAQPLPDGGFRVAVRLPMTPR